MRRQLWTLAGTLALFALLVGSKALADETALPQSQRSVTSPVAQVTALLEAEQQELLSLRAQLERAGDDASALTLQEQIESTKLRTRQSVLQVQIEWAKAMGLTQRTRSLEKSLAQLEEQIVARKAAKSSVTEH